MAELPPQTLQDRVAIVTGSSRGLGAVMALDLAKRGAKVAITYTSNKSQSVAEDLVSQNKALPNSSSAISIRANLADVSAPSTIVSATTEAFGYHIDILVNNAAVLAARSLKDTSIEDYASVYDVNICGVILMT